MRKMAQMVTAKSHWLPWGQFTDTVKSGRSGAQHAFNTDIFSWFQQPENADEWELFNAAMTSFSSGTGPAIANAYDFSRFTRIVDIGGGHGQLLRAILAKAPNAKGVIYDLPDVVKGVRDTLNGRIECIGGSFFESVPAGADCYTMKHIIHDWSDERCRTLLRHVAAAMRPDGRVLICETVMPETAEPHPAKFLDLQMLAMTEGGSERTEREFAELLASAGLTFARVHQTPSPICIVEATKA
jgi:hypothetical protein